MTRTPRTPRQHHKLIRFPVLPIQTQPRTDVVDLLSGAVVPPVLALVLAFADPKDGLTVS